MSAAYEELLATTAERLSDRRYYPIVDRIGYDTLHNLKWRLPNAGLIDEIEPGQQSQQDMIDHYMQQGITNIAHASVYIGEFPGSEGLRCLPWVVSPEDIAEHHQYGHGMVSAELLKVLGRTSILFNPGNAHVIQRDGHDPVILNSRFTYKHEEVRALQAAMKSLPMARFCLLSGHAYDIVTWVDYTTEVTEIPKDPLRTR